MRAKIIKKITGWKVSRNLGGFLEKTPLPTKFEEAWIKGPGGVKLYAHIHRPVEAGVYPGVVFVPGGISPGTDYDKGPALTADDVSSMGFIVLHYDPTGRGRTEGEEDHWGRVHQKELSAILNYFAALPSVDKNNIGILSFSIGIVIASGALARFPAPKIKYLFDWEGPSNRFICTKNDTHKPLSAFPTSNDGFWDEREAARFIGDIECGYFRYQAGVDHVQGRFLRHAAELLNLATRGRALWTRCNDNPVNTVLDESAADKYNWVPEGLNHKGQILKYFMEVQELLKRY